MPPTNATCQMIHKTCFVRHSCNIFIWWLHLTWPDHGISLYIVYETHTYMLASSSLGNPFCKVLIRSFYWSRLSSRWAKKWQFWLLTWPWPNLDLCPFKENPQHTLTSAWKLSIATSPAMESSPTTRSRVGGGSESTPPPIPVARARPHIPAERELTKKNR